MFQTAGDGIRLLGANTNKVRQVWINGCRVIQNKRTGIAFQRAVELVWVRDCYIEMTPPSTDACIDFEPTGSTSPPPSDVVIDSNHLVHGTPAQAVSISGINAVRPARRVRFTNNTLLGGGIGGVHAQEVTVADNTIVSGERGQVMIFRGNFDGLRVERNRIVAPAQQLQGVRLVALDGFSANRVRFVDNQIEVAGVGLELIDPGSSIELRGNRIVGRHQSIGISVRLSGSPPGAHRDIRIIDNTITNFADAAIRLTTSNTTERYEGVEISSNQIDADAAAPSTNLTGIRLARPGNGNAQWLSDVIIANNRFGATISTKIERHTPTVPSINIAGNVGDRVVIQGDGDPEGRHAAPFGSAFLRVDDEATTALYLKVAGTGVNGWVQIIHT